MRSLIALAVILVSSLAPAPAATVHEYDRCVPLTLDGDDWRTVVTLVNLGAIPASYQLIFMGEQGFRAAWPGKLTATSGDVIGQSVVGNLDVGASTQIETGGTGDKAVRGFGRLAVLSGQGIGLATKLVRVVNGRIETSLPIPLTPELQQKSRIPFSVTDTESTELVVVSETMSTTIDLVFRDRKGAELLRDTLNFGEASQLAFALETKYPDLKGKQGTLEWSVTFPGADIYEDLTLSVLALSRSQSGVVTVVPAMSLPQDQGRRSQH